MHISSDHTHGADGHPHVHNHTHTKAVLMQLAAVKSALNNTAKIILKDHIEHCIVDAVASNDEEAINDLNKAIERFME